MAETFLGIIRSFLGMKSQLTMAALPLVIPATATPAPTEIRIPYTAPERKEMATFDRATMLSDTIVPLQQAIGVLREHCGYDHVAFPEVQALSLLSDTMPGISRDAQGTLVITYSFARSSHWNEHDSPEKLARGYGACQEFSAAEKAAMMQVFRNYEAACDVRFEEAENPELAYLPLIAQDQSKITIFYKGEKVGIGGEGHFPDGKVAPIRINPNTEGADLFSVLTHELGHNFGMRHPHDSGEFMASQNSNNATQMSYEKGHAQSLAGNNGLPSTLQLLDIEYLQKHYDPPKARPAQMFIVGSEVFSGTLMLHSEDTLKLQAMPAGILDLRGGAENPSLWQHTNWEKTSMWITQSPTNIVLDSSSQQTVVLGNDSTHVEMQGGSSGTVLTHTNDRIDLGNSGDKVMASCADAVTHIYRFNPAQDTLLYASDARHELHEDGKGGTDVWLFKGTEQAGKVHLYGIPPAMLTGCHIRAMAENEVDAVINAKRPFIYLREGDNGVLTNCTFFHTLQFNTQESVGVLESHFISTAEGNTLITIMGEEGEEVMRATVPGERIPYNTVYHNGEPVKCVEGKASNNVGVVSRWTEHGVMIDARKSASDYVVALHDGIVALGNKSSEILLGEGAIQPYIKQSKSSSVELRCSKNNQIILSRFDVKKDQLKFDADSVVVSPLEKGQAMVALWKNDEPKVHIFVEHFKGDPARLNCEISSGIKIPVSIMPLAEYGLTQSITRNLKNQLPGLQKLAEQEFSPANAPALQSPKKQRGRG